MTARTWVDGPGGGTPINAARLNGMETDITSAKNTSVNVADYGVVMDGSAPTGPQLVNAISAANLLGLPLRLPAGIYAFDQVNIPSNTTIEGQGPNTVIRQNVATQPTFQALGTETTLGVLTSDLVKGATTITFNNTLVSGDLIIVRDNFSYASTDASYKSGEMLRVASATSTVITLDSPVRGSRSNTAGSYTVANGANLLKLTAVKNVTLRNMAFDGHATGTVVMLSFKDVDRLTLEGITTISGQAGFCLLDSCRNVTIERFGIHGMVDNWASGHPGYGWILYQACFNVRIHDGLNTMSRHTITTMGGANGEPRNFLFSNITSADASSTAGIDMHSAGEGGLITGCVIENAINGISCRARNVTIRGNDIRGIQGNGILVNENGANIVIENNRIVNTTGYGVRVGASGSTHNNVAIKNNEIVDTHGTSTLGRGISAGPGQTDLRISRNNIIRTDIAGIEVDASCTDVHIEYNTIIDAALVGTTAGIVIQGTQTAGICDIVGNVVKQKNNLMNRAIYTTRTQGRMTGNRAFGTYLSTGSEFSAGAGFTTADNILYA